MHLPSKPQRIVNWGEVYPKELELAEHRIAKARREHPEIANGLPMYDVGVAVFVNGRIQWHGGATIGIEEIPDRALLKHIALESIQQSFDTRGKAMLVEQKGDY